MPRSSTDILAAATQPVLPGRPTTAIRLTPAIADALAAGAVVALGSSGGKDSGALVLALRDFLDRIDHPATDRVVAHSHLGLAEWPDSLSHVHQVAAHAAMPVLVVERGMLEAWESRWARNMVRYRDLACVTAIMPWSSAAMRFCTAQEKSDPIARALVARFPGRVILNAVGIRAEESAARAKKPAAKRNPDLCRVGAQTSGFDWNPILGWTLDDVRAVHAAAGLALHPAYTTFGSHRLSCNFCVLATKDHAHDWRAALRHPGNHPAFHRIVALELRSTFSFTQTKWLADVGVEYLTDEERRALPEAKQRAAARQALEATIPAHLRFTDGWPTTRPTREEAGLLGEVRRQVGALLGEAVTCTTAAAVLARYDVLMARRVTQAVATPRRTVLPVMEPATTGDQADLSVA